MKKHPKISAISSSTLDPGAKLTADLHGVAASQALWEKGVRLGALIRGCPKSDGLVSMMRAAMDLPFGVHTWRAVRQAGFHNITSDWPRLASPMQRHKEGQMVVILPPLWKGRIDEQSYRDFCHLTGKDFVRRLAQELGDPYLEGTMDSEQEVFKALASRWAGCYPPLLSSYLNFRMDTGAAKSIDLRSLTIPHYSRGRRAKPSFDPVEQALAFVLGELRRWRGQIRKQNLNSILERAAYKYSFSPEDSRWRVLRLLLFRKPLPKVDERYPKRRRKAKKRQFTSVVRLTGEIGEVRRLIELIKGGDEHGAITITRPQRAVLAYFIEELQDEELNEEDVARLQVASFAPRRKFDLRHPVVYRDYFGLGEPTFDPRQNMAEAAKRILACFPHFNGRRAACVVLMTIGDLRVGCGLDSLENFSPYCRYTKNRSQRRGWHPISFLWPDAELEFVRSFLVSCREGNLPDDLQLMKVAGLEQRQEDARYATYTKHTVDFAQLRLRDGLVPGRRLSTHLGRFAFASYWQLRVLAAMFPFLRAMPLFQQLQSHFWFQDEGLEKIGKLLQHVLYNHQFAAASIMGLASPEQLNSTYNRGQPLEIIAWREVLRRNLVAAPKLP